MDEEKAQEKIDRYLMGEMTAEERTRFEHEAGQTPELERLLVFQQKLYEEIEAWGTQKLRKRLDGYYSAYLEENNEEEQEQKFIPLNGRSEEKVRQVRRPLSARWRLGIAAAITGLLLVSALIFIGQRESKVELTEETPAATPVDSLPNVAPGDSLEGKPGVQPKEQPGLPKDRRSVPGEPKENRLRSQSTYALTNIERLTGAIVMAVRHPQELRYTFTNSTLTLFGDPLIPPLRLNVYRRGEELFLQYADDFFRIAPAEAARPLISAGSLPVADRRQADESIRIRLANLQESRTSPADLEVWTATSSQPTFHFDQKDAKKVLVLSGLQEEAKPAIYIVNGQDYFLLLGPSIFVLDPAVDQPTPLQRINGASSANARLFEPGKTFERKVYKIP